MTNLIPLYVVVDKKDIFTFTRRYKNFWEFKAVLKEHNIEIGYY